MDQVSVIRKARGVVRVTFAQGETMLVPSPLFSLRPLRTGATADADEYSRWLRQNEYAHALALAVSYLAARERSRKEVLTRLTGAGYSPEAAGRAADYLIKRGLLSDARMAGQYVQSRGARTGGILIARDLKRRGIDSETAANAIASLDGDMQAENAVRLAARYAARKNSGDPRTLGRRMIGMLMRRGYTFEQSSHAARDVLQGQMEVNDLNE